MTKRILETRLKDLTTEELSNLDLSIYALLTLWARDKLRLFSAEPNSYLPPYTFAIWSRCNFYTEPRAHMQAKLKRGKVEKIIISNGEGGNEGRIIDKIIRKMKKHELFSLFYEVERGKIPLLEGVPYGRKASDEWIMGCAQDPHIYANIFGRLNPQA